MVWLEYHEKRSVTHISGNRELTTFLPRLYAEGFSPIKSWSGGEKQKDGSISFPYPNYNPVVEEFFRLVSSDGWLDHEYNPERAYQMLKDQWDQNILAIPDQDDADVLRAGRALL
jgi:hypothetical protein